MNICLHCNKETLNPKFCCRSCSASYNNKLYPKRITKPHFIRRCIKCRSLLEPEEYYKGRKLCDSCKNNSEIKARSNSYRAVKRVRKNNKERLINEIGKNSCCRCGYNSTIEALEFHHINPSEKSFNISANMNRAYEDLVTEAKKCIVLCANCHRELEAGFWKLPLDKNE